jgi:hypothetical protein
MTKILLDMNQEEFQTQLFKLEKQEQRALLNTLEKIKKLSWEQLYHDKGIRWELINTVKNPKIDKLCSFRFSQKYRGTAYREGDYLILVELFTNHDGAYK